MRRGEIFSAPCIWANSEFLEAPKYRNQRIHARQQKEGTKAKIEQGECRNGLGWGLDEQNKTLFKSKYAVATPHSGRIEGLASFNFDF
jgi:hypothetical protein